MNIVVLDGFTANPGDLSWLDLEQLGNCKVYDRCPPEFLIERSRKADILVTNKCNITAEVIDALPSLKCVCLLAAGYNNVDLVAASRKDIVVCNAAGYCTNSVAQHVFSLILAGMNQVAAYNQAVKNDHWARSEDWTFQLGVTNDLYGKCLGIYGFGRIGRQVARIAHAFGMKIIATRRNRAKHNTEYVTLVSEEELLKQSDVLTLHAPLMDENFHFINETTLSKMKTSAMLINTGRGGLVDEEALIKSLTNGTISFAGLDVLNEEPPVENHPLTKLKNCIITPHIAWSNQEARQELLKITLENIRAFQNGTPQNQVNK